MAFITGHYIVHENDHHAEKGYTAVAVLVEPTINVARIRRHKARFSVRRKVSSLLVERAKVAEVTRLEASGQPYKPT